VLQARLTRGSDQEAWCAWDRSTFSWRWAEDGRFRAPERSVPCVR